MNIQRISSPPPLPPPENPEATETLPAELRPGSALLTRLGLASATEVEIAAAAACIEANMGVVVLGGDFRLSLDADEVKLLPRGLPLPLLPARAVLSSAWVDRAIVDPTPDVVLLKGTVKANSIGVESPLEIVLKMGFSLKVPHGVAIAVVELVLAWRDDPSITGQMAGDRLGIVEQCLMLFTPRAKGANHA